MRQPLGESEQDFARVRGFAARYLSAGDLETTEIGDGNLNRVYRVSTPDTSIIVKQSVPYVWRSGLGWPLTERRLDIEAAAYIEHHRASPHSLPRVLGFDSDAHLLALEDLAPAEHWRARLTADQDDGNGATADHVGRYLARVYARTGTMLCSAAESARLRRVFHDPVMQAFTDRMVFTGPYTADTTNNWPAHLTDVARFIRKDPKVRAQAARARWIFRTASECLTHGDLHTGSVMVGTDGASHIIDLEFAFIGPIAFDLGTLFAHLLLSRLRRSATAGDVHALDHIAGTIWLGFTSEIATLTSAVDYWSPSMERRLLDEVAMFTSTEILRRVGGHFGVPEIDTLVADVRSTVELSALDTWRALSESTNLASFEQLWERATDPAKAFT